MNQEVPDNPEHFTGYCHDSFLVPFFRHQSLEECSDPARRSNSDVSEFNEDPSDMTGSLFRDRTGSCDISGLINRERQTGPFREFIRIIEVMNISDLCDKC